MIGHLCVSTVDAGFAYRLARRFADCLSVIGHFVECYREANFVVGREDHSTRVGSVLSETQ